MIFINENGKDQKSKNHKSTSEFPKPSVTVRDDVSLTNLTTEKNREKTPEPPHQMIQKLSISDSKKDNTLEAASEPVPEQPRVRRGISQAAKNQLIASFIKNAPIRPLLEKNSDSPASRNETKLDQKLEPKDHKPVSESNFNRDSPIEKTYSSDRRSLRPKKNGPNDHQRSSNDTKKPSSEAIPKNSSHDSTSKTIDPENLPDQLVPTPNGGWALVNPSMQPLVDESETSRERDRYKKDRNDRYDKADRNERYDRLDRSNRDRKDRSRDRIERHERNERKSVERYDRKGDTDRHDRNDRKERENRSFKSKRSSYPTNMNQTPQPTQSVNPPATFGTSPMQPMINVQPMMTQSGHMVLLTENGLCVPATPGMFQYEQWYHQSNQEPSSTPYYYPPYYAEETDASMNP